MQARFFLIDSAIACKNSMARLSYIQNIAWHTESVIEQFVRV